VRATTLLRKLLGIAEVFVEEATFTISGALGVGVRPRWRRSRCGRCGSRASRYDRLPIRRWPHLALGRTRIELTYAPWRVCCRRCGVRVERVPWAEHCSRFTRSFEELVAYLAQITDQTKVRELTGIAWKTVGSIVARVVARCLCDDRLEGLRCIGVDEFSYRKRHHYLTVVVDHDRRRVVWAAEGRSGDTLARFFAELGPERCATIELVSIDLAAGYQRAVRSCLPGAEIVYDRFHVQRLASDALDQVRRALVRELEGTEEARAVKKSRYALLKNPWHLTPAEHGKLSTIQRTNRPLFRAYLLKEALARALDYRQVWRARQALEQWLSWAFRSRLKPFRRVARTIRRHLDGILAYVRTRVSNGFTEGTNAKLRMVARRAFGFHSADALIAMLFLTCGGIQLNPPLPTRS
jgi:transposase